TIGIFSNFIHEIYPNNVNFAAVNFQENLPGDKYIWPNGLPDSVDAGKSPYATSSAPLEIPIVLAINSTVDTLASWGNPQIPKGILAGVAFSFNIRLGEEFQDSNGAWQHFGGDEVHIFSYQAN